ncbi:MAG: DUF4402 domain-containing protein [Alphaproteobacteria bacterium PRO2]|nr:DUF4402 domain-containing protein [Alphaproteobacteria bacterium PRO2]
MNFGKKFLALALTLPVYIAGFNAWGAGVSVVTPMYFGHWIVTSNLTDYEVTVEPDGSVTSSPELIELAPPTVGVFDITGLTPNLTVNQITVSQNSPMQRGGGGELWTLEDFVAEPDSPAVDGTGTLRVRLGGTASTSGNGNLYHDDTYEGELELLIELNL